MDTENFSQHYLIYIKTQYQHYKLLLYLLVDI